MLDYNTIIRLKKLGLNNLAIANGAKCKWDSMDRVLSCCESEWGSVDGVPEDLSNEEIADLLYSSRKSIDLSYLQPDCEKILEKQRQGYQRNELWTEYCVEAKAQGMNAYKLSRFNEIVSEYRSKNGISFTMIWFAHDVHTGAETSTDEKRNKDYENNRTEIPNPVLYHSRTLQTIKLRPPAI